MKETDVSSLEVCGGKGLIEKCVSSCLYLTILVLIYWTLDLLQGHLQCCGSLRISGVLVETGYMPPVEWGM
jgi:hypothetical protein